MVYTSLTDLGIEQDPSSFTVGSIMRIHMNNFITYDYCTIYPGPHMNMIVGPNGTGKSTIVCAIAIGLGNSPSVLGRMKECSAFVKHGKQKGYTEITLRSSTPPFHTTIKRVIKSSGNNSDWFIDNEKVSFKRVSELVDSFGIQVDNLCQFLAQDKVSEFSKLDGIALLHETVKASLPTCHLNQLEELKGMKRQFQLVSMQNENVTNEIESLKQQNAAIQAHIDRIREGERKEEQIFLYSLKLLWLQYDVARKEWMDAKDDRERLKELVHQSSVSYRPLEERLEQCKMEIDKSTNNADTFEFLSERENRNTNQISNCKAKILAALKEQTQMKNQLNSLKGDLVEVERQIKQGKRPVEPDWIQPKLMHISTQLDSLQESKFVLEKEKRSIEMNGDLARKKIDALTRDITRLDDIKGIRLEKLKRNSSDSFAACEWITHNLSLFSGSVHLPTCIVVDVGGGEEGGEGDFSGEFEEMLSHQTLTLIVCENDDDFDLLQTELLDKQRLKVSIHLQKSPFSNYTPRIGREQLRALGFSGYLADYVKGPEIVKAALCQLSQIHLIPVTKGTIDEERLFRTTSDIRRFCANSISFSVHLDEEGGRITRTKRISPPRVLSTSYDDGRRESIQSELNQVRREREGNQQRLSQILTDITTLKLQEDQLHSEKTKINGERREILTAIQMFNSLSDRKRNLQSRIDSCTCKLNNQNEIKSLVGQLKSTLNSSIDPLTDISHLSTALSQQHTTSSAWNIAKESFLKKKASLLEEKLQEMKVKNEELVRCLENAELLTEELKQKARDLLQEINSKPLTVDKLNQQQKELLNGASDSVEQLESQIVTLKSFLEVLQAETDERIIQEYKTRQARITTLESSLTTTNQSKSSLGQEMTQLQQQFMSHLQPVIDRVCERFSSFFTRIGCVGQVRLGIPEDDPQDYDHWRLDILVKFREKAPLTPLSFSRQSGGERSVSTFLFMMALQGLSRAPFRVVDEINQGMDAKNESKMHEIMVDCTTTINQFNSQYFLVTPKLLTGLKYNERTTVHCVFNGISIPEQQENKPIFSLASFV